MVKYKYTMAITKEKLADIIEDTTGRRPDGLGKSGLHTWNFTFNEPDLTPVQRQAVLDALPPWLRMVYSFSRKVVSDEE